MTEVNVLTAPEQWHWTTPFSWHSVPTMFLAGPIQGAPDWQSEAVRLIRERVAETSLLGDHVIVANPRRAIVSMGDFTPAMFAEQVAWEHSHLRVASSNGVTLFWLANEAVRVDGRSYAQTTRFELGEAMANHRAHGHAVCVGIDTAFSGRTYIRQTLAWKAPGIPVRDSLKETIDAAINILSQQRSK